MHEPVDRTGRQRVEQRLLEGAVDEPVMPGIVASDSRGERLAAVMPG